MPEEKEEQIEEQKEDQTSEANVDKKEMVEEEIEAEVEEGEVKSIKQEKYEQGKFRNIGEFLKSIVFQALEMDSSDIHIEPNEERVSIRFRVDGLLREVLTMDKNLYRTFLFKVKVESKMKTDEHFAPQDGKIQFEYENSTLDTRISILPTTKGEKIVMRLLSSEGKAFTLEELGLEGRDLEVITKGYKKPYGTIFAVGPTGSGKTTTLYSILKILNSEEVNITTVEDPVEYSIKGVNHVQINPKADLTFANVLRSILRQDPDIIMVGEIRDAETASIAINAAMTGHLVLSTLHTNDAVSTIPRLIDMGIEDFLIASTLNVIVAQRLARRLCSKCKQEVTLTKEEHEELQKMRPDLAGFIKLGEKMFKEKGCEECSSSGFKGRVGLYEVLQVNKQIRYIISNGASTDELLEQAKKDGMTLIVEDGVKKLREGLISLSELTRVTAIKE